MESRWARAEATLADRNKTLLPVMIDACERPIMFELMHTVDLSHWNGDPSDKTWLSYLAEVRRFIESGAPGLQLSADDSRSMSNASVGTSTSQARGCFIGMVP